MEVCTPDAFTFSWDGLPERPARCSTFYSRNQAGGLLMSFPLSLRQRIPKGEYLEKFLKERNLWRDFEKSRERRRHKSEVQALEAFIRKRNLEKEYRSFRDKRLVAIRLSDRAEDLE